MTKSASIAFILALCCAAAAKAQDPAAIERGKYLFQAGDCIACHTDEKGHGAPLAGGRPLPTPFGTFYAPNITPDPQNGIGAWSLADFRHALREGKGQHGEFLFPVFPYTAFTAMTDSDTGDLYAYLMAQPPAPAANKPNEAMFPFSWRFLQLGWRILFFREGAFSPDPRQSADQNRGSYLANAVAHCGECHTPRNFLGGLKLNRAMAGNPNGPDKQVAPNITPDMDTGIGKWKIDEIEDLLDSGVTPDGDYVGSGMADVVRGTGALTKEDRHAIAVYLKSLPPLTATRK